MESHRHLTPEDVKRFLGIGLTLPTLRLVIQELLGDCPVCLEVVEQAVQDRSGT